MHILQKSRPAKVKNNDVVIKAENLGVSFISGFRADDYKSHLFNLLRNKKQKGEQREFWPIQNLSFTGRKGEVLGIIGSNGSGKTTLCKLISGILQPDQGRLFVDGKVTALFSMGMGFNRDLSGRDNVYLNGMMLGIPKKKIDAVFDEIVQFADIGPFIYQPVKHYSSGMRARLGFSVAAFLEPEILIIDEALNTGDLAFSQKAAKKMRELVAQAKMVILVTHSLRYAKKHCDRLMWLDKGALRAIGDPEEVAAQYEATLPPKKPRIKRRLTLKKTDAKPKEETIIKAERLGIAYRLNGRRFWALKNINFEINEGEVVGIIGHNGAGKSTLCKVLTKILIPDQGKISVKGDTTALLSYGTGFNAQLSGRDNIYLNGMLLGIPKWRITRNYSRIVQFAELEQFIDKPVKTYSSGMKSRLGFSIAATLQPDIFIIDEALSTGDIAFQQKASEKIQEMIEQAKAVIIVSHSMGFVEKVCTRVIWLEKGQIRFDGDPKEAVKRYKESIT